jgi:hypothetical protein
MKPEDYNPEERARYDAAVAQARADLDEAKRRREIDQYVDDALSEQYIAKVVH